MPQLRLHPILNTLILATLILMGGCAQSPQRDTSESQSGRQSIQQNQTNYKLRSEIARLPSTREGLKQSGKLDRQVKLAYRKKQLKEKDHQDLRQRIKDYRLRTAQWLMAMERSRLRRLDPRDIKQANEIASNLKRLRPYMDGEQLETQRSLLNQLEDLRRNKKATRPISCEEILREGRIPKELEQLPVRAVVKRKIVNERPMRHVLCRLGRMGREVKYLRTTQDGQENSHLFRVTKQGYSYTYAFSRRSGSKTWYLSDIFRDGNKQEMSYEEKTTILLEMML